MSEELAATTAAYLANFTSDSVQDLIEQNIAGEDVVISDFPRVKMSGKVFMVPTLDDPDGEARKELSGVVIHTHMSRGYWSQPYGEGDDDPDCSSPKADAGTPRSDDTDLNYGGVCSECPMSQWGTALIGKGQACTLSRIVYLLMTGDNLPVVLQIPPTSLGVFKSFGFGLTQVGLMHWQVEVALGVERVTKNGIDFSKLTIRKSRSLSDVEQEMVANYRGAIVPHL